MSHPFGTHLPRWVFIQLLESCNLRCKMCYEWGESGSYFGKKHLMELDVQPVLRVIEECKEMRPHYDLYGGEPLLYRNLGQVIAAIKASGGTVDIPTNGTLLERESETLVESGLDRVWVSLDGPQKVNDFQRGAGVYEKAMHGIDHLFHVRAEMGKSRPKIGIGTVITPDNYRYISQLVLKELDLDKIEHISLELQAFITEEEYERYIQFLDKEFQIKSAPIAHGVVCDLKHFETIDAHDLACQIAAIQNECDRRGIYLNTNPKDMSEKNIAAYFAGQWDCTSHKKSRCPFPWLSMEVSASGDVCTCHSFYDLTLGNIYESSVRDIWNGPAYKHFREQARKGLLPICPSCCLYHVQKPGTV